MRNWNLFLAHNLGAQEGSVTIGIKENMSHTSMVLVHLQGRAQDEETQKVRGQVHRTEGNVDMKVKVSLVPFKRGLVESVWDTVPVIRTLLTHATLIEWKAQVWILCMRIIIVRQQEEEHHLVGTTTGGNRPLEWLISVASAPFITKVRIFRRYAYLLGSNILPNNRHRFLVNSPWYCCVTYNMSHCNTSLVFWFWDKAWTLINSMIFTISLFAQLKWCDLLFTWLRLK